MVETPVTNPQACLRSGSHYEMGVLEHHLRFCIPKTPVASLSCKTLHTAGLRVVYICRTFKEGIVPFKPTAYGLHNLLRRNDLLVSRAKVSD